MEEKKDKIEIKYDQEIEVSKTQYDIIMGKLAGVCAGRIVDGKHFIKVWVMSYKKIIEQVLENVA